MAARFEIYRGKIGDFHWKLIHANGRIIARSDEGYTSKVNAVHGISSVKQNVRDAVIKDGTKSED